MKHPYYYRPDEFFDFGFAGEHPVEFVAWIDEADDLKRCPVRIISIIVYPQIKDPKNQQWNITELVRKYPQRLERYEDEIRGSWLSKREKDWEEGA